MPAFGTAGSETYKADPITGCVSPRRCCECTVKPHYIISCDLDEVSTVASWPSTSTFLIASAAVSKLRKGTFRLRWDASSLRLIHLHGFVYPICFHRQSMCCTSNDDFPSEVNRPLEIDVFRGKHQMVCLRSGILRHLS